MKKMRGFYVAMLLFLGALPAFPQIPEIINYQGRIQVQGTNFTGTGLFKFSIGTENMGAVYWSNDGTLAGEPAASVQGDLDKGLYSIGLGDTTLAGMGALDPAVLASTGLWLRVWFSDGVLGFEQLVPDKPLASVPYALVAGRIAGLSGFSVTNLDDVTDAGSGMIITDAERALINSNQTTVTNLQADLDSETASRIAADAALSGDLAAASNSLSIRITQNETGIASNLSSIASVEFQVSILETGKVSKTGDTMTGALVINDAGSDGGILISSTGASISVGTDADGSGHGLAVGRYANGSGYGAAHGYYADGSDMGAAQGYSANAGWYGAAVGALANGSTYGAALGYDANAAFGGLALGSLANAPNGGIAVGSSAAAVGTERIAIGNRITNAMDNSAAVRGTLYLDGGTAVFYRASAGTGEWVNLLSQTVTGTPLYAENDPLAVKKTGDTMTGALIINNASSAGGILINSTGTTIAIGTGANGSGRGLAVGRYANGAGYGAAHGYYADGSDMGAAQGYAANAEWYGAAVGPLANGTTYGAALGYDANAAFGGLALGASAHAPNEGIALGQSASADGTNRITIGNRITNAVNNSAAVRGTLYLDGGTAVYYRATTGSGAWSDIRSGMATGMPVYVETDPVWTAEKSGYATGTPLYAFTESDPGAVLADGSRAMTGNLDMGGNSITNISTNSIVFADGTAMGVTDVQNWNTAYGWGDHSAAGYTTGTFSYTETDPLAVLADGTRTMTGLLNMGGNSITNAASLAFDDINVEIGDGAMSYSSLNGSIAVGKGATARYRQSGVAIGTEADGDYNGIGIGYQADGQYSNIAVGFQASAYSGYDRIAIGCKITNRVNNSCAIRGTLYLDGGTGVMVRSTFGTGAWSAKAFTIDHPLDPENMVLRHFCLEGPEVLNVYSGNAVLDDAGEAVIKLPDYYDSLNKDPRYTLTPIGAQMDLYIKQEISDNQFMVAGGVPGGKISWEVKALRSDPALLEDIRRRPVEQPKSELTPDQMVQENETVNTFP
ncbi:MAG: beta strand repeat-containing protein [Kiritimatiellia bacterium]